MRALYWMMLAIPLAVGCGGGSAGGGGGGSGGGTSNPRPAGSPDYVILSFSGHCFPSLDRACHLRRPAYLEQTSNQLKSAIQASGKSVAVFHYSDDFWSHGTNGQYLYGSTERSIWAGWVVPGIERDGIGFTQAIYDLGQIGHLWISNFSNPTKIIVIAHSHGTVWAHALLHQYQVPVEVLIDLDGVSKGWEDDDASLNAGDEWWETIADATEKYGFDWPTPGWWNVTESWAVPGQAERLDWEDVTPDSVQYNLEIWAGNYGFLDFYWNLGILDDYENYRPDGTEVGLFLMFSEYEDHKEVAEPYSDAMEWVESMVIDLLP